MSLPELVSPPAARMPAPERPGLRAAPLPGASAVLAPAARHGENASAVLGRRRPTRFDPHASAAAWLLARGSTVLDPALAERAFGGLAGDRPLVVDEGCDVRSGSAACPDAVRVALLEWLPLEPAELAAAEYGLFHDRPVTALTLLVRPPLVWSLADALAAERRLPRDSRFDPARFAALERYARERVGPGQLQRLRRALLRLEAQLPLGGLPVATACVAEGCAAAVADDRRCAGLAATALARYACSALVARQVRLCTC